MLTVLWHDKEAAGYTDLLPDDWFVEEDSLPDRVHLVRGPRSGRCKAKCNVKVTGSCADLDYESFVEFNTKHKMYLGIMRIQFESTDRARVTQIFWKDKGSKSYKVCSTTIGYEESNGSALQQDIDLLDVSMSEGRKKLVTHLKRERNPKLVAAKKAAVLAVDSKLACEACMFIFEDKYGELGKNYCEVHHRKPLAAGHKRQTYLSDLAIMCSNCHRMIHRTDPMLSIEEFREIWLTI